jgi:dynein heavy chain 2
VQALRPDRLISALLIFCRKAQGLHSLSPLGLSPKQIKPETAAEEPILFVITPGADPSQEILDFALSELSPEKYREVAMGQGQGDIALEYIKSAAREGHWVLLKNIHLVLNWIDVLEKELTKLTFHKDFRLWITSEMNPMFPTSFLNKCLRITVEAPPGVKNNITRLYGALKPGVLESGSVIMAQSVLVLSWFHAVIQERRNFLPQGWSKFYEFSLADYKSTIDIIEAMCKDSKKPQWDSLQGMIENAIYGGRVDDVQDIGKLQIYLRKLFNAEIGAKKITTLFDIPNSSKWSDYKALINNLPETDNAVHLGLPANIDRTIQKNYSRSTIFNLNQMVPEYNQESDSSGSLDF